MSEIWDTDVNGALPSDDDEDWEGDSDSELHAVRCHPKRKREQAMPGRRGYAGYNDANDDQQDHCDEAEDDDEFSAILAAAAAKRAKQAPQQQQHQQPCAQHAQPQRRFKPNQQGSSRPGVQVGSGEASEEGPAVGAAGQPAASNGHSNAAAATPAAAATGAMCNAGVLSERARKAAERDAALRKQLQEAAAAGLDGDDEEDEGDMVEQVPSSLPCIRPSAAAADVEDTTCEPDDIERILQAAGADAGQQQHLQPGTAAAAAAAAGAASGPMDADEGGKVALTFRTQGCEDVAVFVKPSEPLAAALDKFKEYVAKQGWGTVQKFLSPDGDKLTGAEAATDLDLEDGDTIEYYLQKY